MQFQSLAAAAPLLGAATLDPVDATGKQEFGFEAGDVLKLKYMMTVHRPETLARLQAVSQ